tara:strand:- start:693 stop:1262 length:570 start_codon:yes stop_codon:yes gene_type:complete
MSEKLEMWNRVCKTDPKHTKKAKIGGMEITAVAPQYQILNATREFGTYGVAWGFKEIELDSSLIEKFNLIVFKGTFFCPGGEFQIINSSKMFMDRAENMIDADFAKKIETDALTKALSKMGFNADIFMGRFDDVKYVNEMKEEFKVVTKPLPLSDDRFKAALLKLKEGKTTAEAIKKFKLTASQLDLIK